MFVEDCNMICEIKKIGRNAMNLNGVYTLNNYLKPGNPETITPANSLTKEQSSDLSKNTLNQDNGALSNQAFQVTITDQAREILRTEQTSQAPQQPRK